MNIVFLAVSVKVANVWIKVMVFYLGKIRARVEKIRHTTISKYWTYPYYRASAIVT
jgi:hypothetical protein